MADVNALVDYEYKVSGAEQAAGQMNSLATATDQFGNKYDKTTGLITAGNYQISDMIVKLGLAAVAYKALTGAVDFFRDSIESAIDANEDWNKFQVVMGDNAMFVNNRLEDLADTTNRNVLELRSLAAGVQDMLVPMGVARDEATGLSSDFVQLAIDIGSFNNAPTADVLSAIQSALAGQSRPLRQFGVDTRVAALEAQAFSMGIDQSWESMDQATQAHVLYAKVVADSADAQGDAVRTADEAANVMVGLKSAFEEGKVAIGDEFLPVIEALVPLLRDELADALPILQDIAERIASDMLKYGPSAIKYMGLIVDTVGFAVDRFDELQDAMQWLGGPGVLMISKGIELFGDSQERAARQTDWFTEAVDASIGTIMQFERTLPPGIQYTADLGTQIQTLTNFTKDLTREQIAAAMATVELNMVELQRSADLKGGVTPAIAAHIAELNAYVVRLKSLAGEIGTASAAASSAGGGSAGGMGGGMAGKPDDGSVLKFDYKAAAQAEIEVMQMVNDKQAEFDAMQMQRQQALYEQRIQAIQGVADRSIDIIVGGFTGGFDQVLDGFKNMLGDLAAEYLKSQIYRAIFGVAGKAATGGAGIFL